MKKVCVHCGDPYSTSNKSRKYCSVACCNEARTDRPLKKFEDAFFSKIEMIPIGGCWIWMGTVNHGGYGKFTRDRKRKIASIVSYEYHNGPIPNGLWVLHHCDTPSCVNPHHLFLGTVRDNVHDMIKKGRAVTPRGETHPFAKLTIPEVLQIRDSKESSRALGRKFGVSKHTILSIRNGRTWNHVSS